MNDDTAEYFQVAYDKCVYRHGPDSPQAKEAEAQAKQFFTNKRVDGPRLVSTPSPVAST